MTTSFNDTDLNAADTAEMTVIIGGKPTDWTWTFAGPGHPKTVAQTDKLARERLHTSKLQDQARVNGKKWVAPEESVEDIRKRNVDFVVERLLGWTDVQINGADYPFSIENARTLLADPRKDLLSQAYEALGSDAFFTQH